MIRRILATLALLVPLAVVGSTQALAPAAAVEPTRHLITNLHSSTAPAGLGYDVFDTGAYPSTVNALPDGVQAMVWLGQKCPTPIDATFRAKVDALAGNPKVFGYYLSDEPHIADCPGGPAALATRADYIRAVHPAARTFIVLSRQADMRPFAPAKTHVDLIGLDPYPCSVSNPQCDLDKIGQRVGWATSAGIPVAAIVPTFQAFGQEKLASPYYLLPTADQMQAMLAEWREHIPHPVLDYTYGWGNQSSSNPTLTDSPALQQVMADHIAGRLSTDTGCQ